MSQLTINERAYFRGTQELTIDANKVAEIYNEKARSTPPLRTLVEMVCGIFGIKFEAASKSLYTLTHPTSQRECDNAMREFNKMIPDPNSGQVVIQQKESGDKVYYQYCLRIGAEKPIPLCQVWDHKKPASGNAKMSVSEGTAPTMLDIRLLIGRHADIDEGAHQKFTQLMEKKHTSLEECDQLFDWLRGNVIGNHVQFSRKENEYGFRYSVTMDGETYILRELAAGSPQTKRQARAEGFDAEQNAEYADFLQHVAKSGVKW